MIRERDRVRCVNRKRKAYGKTATVLETDGASQAFDWMKIRWDSTKTESVANPRDFEGIK